MNLSPFPDRVLVQTGSLAALLAEWFSAAARQDTRHLSQLSVHLRPMPHSLNHLLGSHIVWSVHRGGHHHFSASHHRFLQQSLCCSLAI